MPQANFADGTKVCSSNQCALVGQPQPLENFTKDESRADGFKSQCNGCRNKTKRPALKSPEWNARVKQEKEQKKAAERTAVVVSKINRQVAQAGTFTEELAAELVQSGGGVRAIANDFWGTMGTANETTKLRGFQTAFSVMNAASDLQAKKKRDVEDLTDEELDALIAERERAHMEAKGLIIDGEFSKVE